MIGHEAAIALMVDLVEIEPSKAPQGGQGYIKYAELHQGDAYPAHLPVSLQGGKEAAEQPENGGKDSEKPAFRVVGA